MQRAAEAYKNNQYEEALEIYTQELKKERKFSLLTNRAFCLIRLKRYEEALGDADAAIALPTAKGPGLASALYARALCLMHAKQLEKAKAAFIEALELDPTNTSAWKKLHQVEQQLSKSSSSSASSSAPAPRSRGSSPFAAAQAARRKRLKRKSSPDPSAAQPESKRSRSKSRDLYLGALFLRDVLTAFVSKPSGGSKTETAAAAAADAAEKPQ